MKNILAKRNEIFLSFISHKLEIEELTSKLYPLKTSFSFKRYGSKNDGGYLLPNDLEGIKSCFSPGVSDIANFELQLLKENNIPSHLADYSVAHPPSNFTPKSFTKKFIGPINNDKFITLKDWMENCEDSLFNNDFILQMDIEGAEYSALIDTPVNYLNRFRIIVIEIHNVHSWGCKDFFNIAINFFDKLLHNHHIIHNHPNNCCGLVDLSGIILPAVFELTLIRKDREAPIDYATNFPHRLDSPNLTNKPNLILPKSLYYQNPNINNI